MSTYEQGIEKHQFETGLYMCDEKMYLTIRICYVKKNLTFLQKKYLSRMKRRRKIPRGTRGEKKENPTVFAKTLFTYGCHLWNWWSLFIPTTIKKKSSLAINLQYLSFWCIVS
jgi:hypothetical protein